MSAQALLSGDRKARRTQGREGASSSSATGGTASLTTLPKRKELAEELERERHQGAAQRRGRVPLARRRVPEQRGTARLKGLAMLQVCTGCRLPRLAPRFALSLAQPCATAARLLLLAL